MTEKESISSTHQTGDEFGASEENLHLIFDQIPYILEMFTPDGMTFMVNKQWEETYQTDKSQVIGKFNLLEDPQIKELGVLPLLQRAFNGEQVVMPDSEFDPAKSQYPGRKRWLRTKVIPIKDAGGEVKFVVIMHEDITERKNAEDALRESEEKYRNIFNSVLDVYFETDIPGKIMELSPSIERLIGYKRQELIGQSAFDLYADLQKRKTLVAKITAESIVNDYEIALVHKNGEVIAVSVSAELEKDSAGVPLKIKGTMRDITERKQTEEELRQNREAALQFSKQLAILQEVTNQLSQTESSDELCKLAIQLVRSRLGFDRAAIHFLGEHIGVLIGSFGTDERGNIRDERGYRVRFGAERLAWRVLSRKEPIAIVENSPLYNHLGQEVGKGELAVAALWDGDETIGILSVDNFLSQQLITEHQKEILRLYATSLGHLLKRKQVEDELRQHRDNLEELVAERTTELASINEELEAFSYSVSHDLRTPLRHINGYLDALQEKTSGVLDAESQQYIGKIAGAAQKMNLLIEGLLTLSRLGRQQLSKKKIDLSALAKEVIKEHLLEVQDREIQWQIAELPSAFGDPIMLRIVFSNLISNALKYTHPRQSAIIEIGSLPSVQTEDIVFIRDNGVGFDVTFADRLFGVFQRMHHADEFEGTGIGLATVQRIIHRHGGRIWAEAKVDEGATFYFALPQDSST